MSELGFTNDPVALVPGSVSRVAETVWSLRSFSESLESAFTGLSRIETERGWRGEAADRFREVYAGQTAMWSDASVAFEDAATALDGYASSLQWAQGKARDAIDRYAEGDRATKEAVDTYNAKVRTHNAEIDAGGTPAPLPPFRDPGEEIRAEARETLTNARTSLEGAAGRAATALRTAVAKAPEEPSLLARLGEALGGAAEWLGGAAYDLTALTVNSLASFGNAMIENPWETAAFVGGIALMVLGGAGEVGGVALDLTGVGAVVGVPINVAAAGVITAGAALAGTAAVSLGMHAATDSRVEVMESRAQSSGPSTQGKRGTPTDRQKEHLTEKDLDAARRELNGEVVARKSSGQPWDHVQEVRNAQQGLRNRIAQLQRMLGDTRLSPEAKQAAQSELSEASKLLEHSKGYVP